MSAVLTVESVSKEFVVQRSRPRTVRESLIRRLTGHRDRCESVWALRDVSFSVERGVALGVVGHNGAGKSTLLRLICGLGRPTAGRIARDGHMSSLLELGGGFHLDLSGRDNILTAGLLSGLTEREIRTRERDIIGFAELEHFIDQPVRTYSTGMYMRLAFAVAFCFDPAILVVDEVFAVGDARFQQKCLERIGRLRAAGKTLVITSHSREHILAMCDEVLVLEEGRAVTQADPKTAIGVYDDLMRQRTARRARELYGGEGARDPLLATGKRQGTQEARIVRLRVTDDRGHHAHGIAAGDGVTIDLDYDVGPGVPDLAVILGIFSETHVKCFETLIPSATRAFGSLGASGTLRCRFPALPLLAGRYYVNVGLYPPRFEYIYDHHWQIHVLHVVPEGGSAEDASGVVALRPMWSLGSCADAGDPSLSDVLPGPETDHDAA